MLNPYALRQKLDEAKLRYYDVEDDDDIEEFCQVLIDLVEDDYEQETD